MPVDVAVVIGTQGRQPLLRRTLEALRGEQGPREIVVVAEGTAANVRRFLPPEVPVRVVEEAARGLNSKRNRGAAAATAAHLLFTDDDCVPAAGWAAACHAALLRHPVVTGRVLPLNPGLRASIRTSTRPAVHRANWWNRARAWRLGCGNNLGVRREVLEAAGGFCERIGVGTWSQAACDSEFLFRVLARGGEIAYVPEAVVLHSQPLDRAAWLRKRRGYYRGISYLARRIHPKSPAAWTMALGRLLGCQAGLVAALLSLRGLAARRAWAELRGSLEGLRPPREVP